MSQFWKITGFDGSRTVYERQIPLESLSKAEMIGLLRLLAATHLDEREVVSSALGELGLLEVRDNTGGKPALMTTALTGHHYTATIQEGDDAHRT